MKLSAYRIVAPKINKGIEDVLKANGFDVTKLNTSVNEQMGTISINVKARDLSESETPEQKRWKQYANLYGLKPEWLGQSVKINGHVYEIGGLRDSRSAKNVAIIQNGKTYIIEHEKVIKAMEAA